MQMRRRPGLTRNECRRKLMAATAIAIAAIVCFGGVYNSYYEESIDFAGVLELMERRLSDDARVDEQVSAGGDVAAVISVQSDVATRSRPPQSVDIDAKDDALSGVTYSELQSALLARYFNESNAEEMKTSEQLRTALMAMERAETSGEPTIIGTSKSIMGQDGKLAPGVTYTQLRRAVLAKYFVSDADENRVPGSPARGQLELALKTMRRSEDDGEPVGIKKHPYLYVGSVGAAYNLEALRREGITHIVNMSPAVQCKYPTLFTYCNYPIIDDIPLGESTMGQLLEITSDFIEDARVHGGKVLVHCMRGKSRSVSVVTGYLIKYHGLTRDEALSLVRRTRRATPFRPYLDDLKAFERRFRKDAKGNKL